MTEETKVSLPLLTNSRMSCARTCRRKHYLMYEVGLRRIRSADALRFGSGFHLGLDVKGKGATDEEAIEKATAGYDICPQWANPDDWELERVILATMLAGHFWRYSQDNLQFIATEQQFRMPIVNPETGARSRTFEAAGKIDGIVTLQDGRQAVLEYKTTSDDLAPESDYWLRLRCDGQISLYVLAARHAGFRVDTVLYDVTRKPTIRPKLIPTLDIHGKKIVIDTAGQRVFKKDGSPRESASEKDGWVVQQTRETPAQFGERLLQDIGERPDFYFQRREVPRLQAELDEFEAELWQQAQAIRDSQLSGRWFKNVSALTCDFCEYKDLCLNSVAVNPASPPAGFEIVANVHQELATE